MWIHSIKLRNFKSYDHAEFSFPQPEDGRNIVLVGAQNGHGKTTLLEAVYLCLYDKDAISHLQRAGLNTQKNNYPEFLKSARHHEAELKYGQYDMGLEIEIRQNYRGAAHGLRIKRTWHFDSRRNPIAGENGHSLRAEILKSGLYEPVKGEEINQYINAFALPFDYAPFFFFDGEKIVQTAQQSGTGFWLKAALKGLLREDLFYPLPPECADKIEHNYLSVNAHAEIQNEIGRLQGMPQEQPGTLLAENDKHEAEHKRISAEIEALKGTNKDELVEQLKTANEETEKYKERAGHLKSNVIRQEKEHQRLQKEVEDLQNAISDSNPKLLKSRRAGEVDKVIVRLTGELPKKKVNEVSEAATRINRAIAHDDRIDRIRVETDGHMGLFGKDGYESRVDLSAGQMQILIMSLVSALAEVIRYHAPFIIDTPLARLDEGRRGGLFKHWCGLEQQVILLSQDAEITAEVYKRLEPHVCRTYLVEAQSLNSAGARSRVSADV